MRHLTLLLLIFTAPIVGFAQDSIPKPAKSSLEDIAKYETSNKDFTVKGSGRLFIDYGYLSENTTFQENYGALEDNNLLRLKSAEFNVSGTLFQNTEFKFKAEFAGNKVSVREGFVGFKNLPGVGTLRVGYIYEPLRFSSLSSSKYSSFMERSKNHGFSPKNNLGAVVFNDFLNDRLSAQAGVFHNGSNSKDNLQDNDGYAITSRVVGLPYVGEQKLLHLGAGFSYRKPDSKEYVIPSAIGSYLSDKKLKAEVLSDVNNINLLNLEAVYIHKAVAFQTEYIIANVHTDLDNFQFWNYYAEVSWFLTGESKNYSGGYKGFSRLKPNRNFGSDKNGIGAWEIAGRYSKTDLTDGMVQGGIQSEFLLGLNWHLNPYTRLMIDYIHTDLEDNNKMDVIQARLQVDL